MDLDLLALRAALDLDSNRKLAPYLGAHHSHLSRYLHGERPLPEVAALIGAYALDAVRAGVPAEVVKTTLLTHAGDEARVVRELLALLPSETPCP